MSGLRDQLVLATTAVAAEYAGPRCVEGCALMVEVGSRIGIELDALPVSVFAINLGTGESVSTGDMGRAYGERFLSSGGRPLVYGHFDGGSPFQRHAGHMIVTSIEHGMLIDPTFSQFGALDAVAVPLFVDEIQPKHGGKLWDVEDETFFARYFVAREYMEGGFEELRLSLGPAADRIVNLILRQDKGELS